MTPRTRQFLAALIGISGLVIWIIASSALLGYFLNEPRYYTLSPVPMASNTAICFWWAGVGFMATGFIFNANK